MTPNALWGRHSDVLRIPLIRLGVVVAHVTDAVFGDTTLSRTIKIGHGTVAIRISFHHVAVRITVAIYIPEVQTRHVVDQLPVADHAWRWRAMDVVAGSTGHI